MLRLSQSSRHPKFAKLGSKSLETFWNRFNSPTLMRCKTDVFEKKKNDVTGDDTQRRFLAQHRVAMLEQW